MTITISLWLLVVMMLAVGAGVAFITAGFNLRNNYLREHGNEKE